MRLKSRKATIGDAISVLARMSDVTKAELQVLGRGHFETLVATKDYLEAGEAICVHTRQPLFVLGLVPHAMVPNLLLTWFFATQEWFDLGAKGVLLGRKIMRDLAARHPAAIIQSVSLSPHPDAPRWFALHGFEEVDRGGNYAVFEYARRRSDAVRAAAEAAAARVEASASISDEEWIARLAADLGAHTD